MVSSATAVEIRTSVEAAFRDRVAMFYRALQLTPPYHSVEKAQRALRDVLCPLPFPALQALAADESALGLLFTQVLRDSGLAKKHKGIIKGLLAEGTDRLPSECRPFADAFRG